MSLFESAAYKMRTCVEELADADCFDDLEHSTDDLLAREDLYLLTLRYARNYERLFKNEQGQGLDSLSD